MQDSEHIGDVYQDEFNQAALLLYRDKTDDALLMVRFTELIITYLTLIGMTFERKKNGHLWRHLGATFKRLQA